jgi:hypothetical protein
MMKHQYNDEDGEEDEENDEHMKICTFSLSLFFFLEKKLFWPHKPTT